MTNIPERLNSEMLLNVLAGANYGTAIYTTAEIVIQFANDMMLSYWGKDRSVIGQALEEAVPELRGQPFKQMLQNVLRTGVADTGIIPAETMLNGSLQTHYYEYEYRLVSGSNGQPDCILHTAINVTQREENRKLLEQRQIDTRELTVNLAASNQQLHTSNAQLEKSRQDFQDTFTQLEESEIALRLAIEAANFGTWRIHSVTREFIVSARLKELFGYRHDETISIEQAIAQITDEYRDFVADTLEKAIYQNGDYDVTYQVRGYHDNKLRWLRAIGNLKVDSSGEFSAFTGVVMDVSEMKMDEQRKNDFIGMVSHELKTPLTTLSGYVQLLQDVAKKSKDDFGLRALEIASKQVKKMTTLINGFLNVSRLESGKIYIDKQRFDMASLVKEAEEETSHMIASHNIVFAPVETTWVVADRDKIGQVISNFINNAIKYSPRGTTINVACLAIHDHVVLSVKDEGIGIAPEDIGRLFDRFYRVQNKQLESIPGFGIGLYLCSEIIQRHEGEIWVESEFGKGAAFYFKVPLEPRSIAVYNELRK